MSHVMHIKREEKAFAESFKDYFDTYNTAVGFDLVKCRVYVEDIDWDTLEDLISRSPGRIDYGSGKLEDHLKWTLSTTGNPPLGLMGNDNDYSAIIVDYRLFKLQLFIGK